MRYIRLHTPLLLCVISARYLPAEESPAPARVQYERIHEFLDRHCVDCHGAEDPEGDLSLEALGPVAEANAEMWERVLKQVATDEMPPQDELRPDPASREALIDWVMQSLKKVGRTPQLTGGPLPADANLVDHERLFSGRIKGPAYSPPRFWRRSQPQYDALMERLWVIPKLRYEKAGDRNDPKWAAYSYSQPFPGLDPKHFTNYSGSVHADEAALRALMNAGSQIAERLIADEPAYSKELQPPIAVGIPSIRRGSKWERFKLDPPARPKEFEPFVGAAKQPTVEQQEAAIDRIFQLFLNRTPSPDERKRYGGLLNRGVEKRGPMAALRGLIVAVMVSPEFVFRMELGMGEKDEHGRRMLSSHELVYAVAYALTDAGPNDALREAAAAGKLTTRADVEREVRRLLADDSVEKSRPLRFFQEFFGYHRAAEVFKDKSGWKHSVKYLVRDADLLIEHVLKRDRNVFAELLTTDRYFVAYPKIDDPELFEAVIQNTLEETKAQIEKLKQRGKRIGPHRLGNYSRPWIVTQGLTPIPRTVHGDRQYHETAYFKVYGFDGNKFNWTDQQPMKVPGRRAGVLTHPAWLIAHSTNFANYVVGRGHWIREHLLAGTIPDVPIEVQAQVPDEPDSTLRHRMRVTRDAYCWRCHQRMDPLGLPFEMYDHYGNYRTEEMVGAKKKIGVPVDASGEIVASGEPGLDGPVDDAIELVHKLAEAPRVRQSFIRHAFRYWMGRNETLRDSPTLIAADQAYVANEGSFNEVIVSLLTSDSFLYRRTSSIPTNE